MHLAYLDESGVDGYSPVVMFGAAIVPHGEFGHLEALHSAAIQQIIPLEKIEEFKEFHAYELYNGTGPFIEIDKAKRFAAIRLLLTAVGSNKLPFVYAAVDRQKFSASIFGSGKPLYTAFHMCLLGVEEWARANHPQHFTDRPHKVIQLDFNDTCLYILDDCESKELKEQFRKTYRTLRVKRPFVAPQNNRLWHAHDDMFFGDSKNSVGIQISDLCNYFVRRHLSGEPEPEGFYEMFAEQVICAKPEPEWSTYGDLFREHAARPGRAPYEEDTPTR